jgi:glycosyltransferase involved in cell wall biosynthesis
MRLSIIIPAYKVEAYIEKCIRSLEDQDIDKAEYEIIVTNDGSPDNGSLIVEKLQLEFPNIVLINQKNQGVSMARNNAIDVARGEYILPIDPDDYVLPNTFSGFLQVAESKQLDVLYLGFEILNEKGIKEWNTNFSKLENHIYKGIDAYFAPRGYDVRDPDRSWAILYKKSMLDKYDIKYPKGVPVLEDGLFLGKVFSVAERVSFLNIAFYQRTTRSDSAINTRPFYSESVIMGFIKAAYDIKNFVKKINLKHSEIELANHVIAKFVFLSLSSSASSLNYIEYFKIIKVLKEHDLTKLDNNGVRFLYKNYVDIFNKSKLLFPLYYRFYKK